MHQYGAGTNVGNVRDNNEDSYVCDLDKELWIVADGMGGLGFGEVASAITTYTVTRLIRQGHGVNQAIEVAHKRIKEYAESDAMGTNMGTTIVLLLSQGSLFNIFWVGDSRAYSFQGGNLNQITIDHSLVQSLIDQGELTREQAKSDPRKNAVTRALGVQELETVRADSISDKWQPGQKILLCSDGLTDCVSNEQIASILNEEGSDQDKVDKLIERALDQEGKDNITVVLVSAPETTRKPDSDTESPTNEQYKSDDTHIPDNDTESREERMSSEHQEPNVFTGDRHEEQQHSQKPADEKSPGWQRFLVGGAIVLVLALFARLSSSPTHEDSFFSPFQLDETPATGVANTEPGTRALPDFNAPEPAPKVQVGVFSRLGSAESRQQILSDLGLLPWIRKRPTDEGVLYVVFLGPYHDQQRKDSALATLEAHNLDYIENR
ncbi:MAG: protein phosphatase 2C domain-containing protein [Pseudomonadales bacterium]|nr:protein phosphatase 2C domain-containing protein [Pseudomonadales bacterium]